MDIPWLSVLVLIAGVSSAGEDDTSLAVVQDPTLLGNTEPREGSRQDSHYVKQVPSYRHTRAYSNNHGRYSYYYKKYPEHARTPVYSSQTKPSDDTLVCVNYEANENGDVLGPFTCPLPFEPKDFVLCCGYRYAEYCCKSDEQLVPVWWTVAGSIAALLVIASGCYLCYQHYRNKDTVEPEVPPTMPHILPNTSQLSCTQTSGDPLPANFEGEHPMDFIQPCQGISPYKPTVGFFESDDSFDSERVRPMSVEFRNLQRSPKPPD